MSGIYINELEMPKEGGALCIIIHHDGKVCHFFDLQGEQIATAVSVPPHGRLIDADALKEYFLNAPFCLAIFEAFKKLQRMPTIIPADKEGEG